MSWGGPEFASETLYDSYFTTPSGHTGVTFVASSGDSGSSSGPSWPAVSPNVIGVGGTSLTLNSSGQAVQTVWSGSGGGISRYETQPAYQHGVVTQTSTARAVPDVSYVADPSTGVSVYSASMGWTVVGGTSVGAPQFSALIAIIDQGLALKGIGSLDGANQALPTIYAYSSTFTDVTAGSNGAYSASPGYDLATGLGTPNAVQLANAIMTNGVVTDAPTTTTPPVIPNPPPATPPTPPPSFPSQPPSGGSPTLPPDQPTQPVPQPPVTTPTFGSWFSHFRSHRSNSRSGNFSYFGSSHTNRFSWL